MNDIYLDPAMAILAADSMQQRGEYAIVTQHNSLYEPDLRWWAMQGWWKTLASTYFIRPGSLNLTRRAMELLGVVWSEDSDE